MIPFEWMVRRLVLPLVCLLFFAFSAPAECAWVMWSTDHENHWNALGVYTSAKACNDAIYGMLQTLNGNPKIREKMREGPPITYTCLPDTVDPRGPRGKWAPQVCGSFSAARHGGRVTG